jgi:hypothetical protein
MANVAGVRRELGIPDSSAWRRLPRLTMGRNHAFICALRLLPGSEVSITHMSTSTTQVAPQDVEKLSPDEAALDQSPNTSGVT